MIEKCHYDTKANAIYIKLSSNGVAYTKPLDDIRIVDYDSNDNPVGIELLCVSNGVLVDDLPNSNEVTQLLTEKNIRILV